MIFNTHHVHDEHHARDRLTRVVELDAIMRRQNSGMFGNDPEQVPSRALTMGAGTILKARHLLLMAVGSGKASIINKALNGSISETVNTTAIRLHDKTTIILDEAAASLWKRPTI